MELNYQYLPFNDECLTYTNLLVFKKCLTVDKQSHVFTLLNIMSNLSTMDVVGGSDDKNFKQFKNCRIIFTINQQHFITLRFNQICINPTLIPNI